MICRTLAEVRAAGQAAAAALGPLTQDQADLVAAILATAPQPAASAA
jgi:hypothetical protein